MKYRTFVVTLGCGLALVWASVVQAQLLHSWEGSTEGWTAESGFSISNTSGGPNAGIGVTDGTDSLQVNVSGEGFQRWGSVNLDATRLADLTAAAANPLTRRLEFDVTYDASLIPQGTVTFISQQIALQTNEGWSQVDFTALSDGQTNETIRYRAPISKFATVNEENTSAQILIAVNSDWGANLSGTVFYDNLAITQIVPDLNTDGSVDPLDWGIFIGAHNTDLSGLDATEQFLMGDLDSDADNDFDDFLIFEAAYDEANGDGAFRALIPEPTTGILLLLGLVGVSLLRKRSWLFVLLFVVACSLSVTGPATAQLTNVQLNGWETGLEGWMTFGSGIPSSVAVATVGVTEGTQSLGVTQDEESFSWAAQVNYGAGSAAYNAIAEAVDIGVGNYAIEFDVTFDTSSIPQDSVTTVSTSVALNSDGGWIDYGGVAASTGLLDETIHVEIPLDQVVNPPTNTSGTGELAPASGTGFYQINFGMDGDWGLDPATFYFDDLRLVQLTEPDVLTIEVNRATGELSLMNPGTSSFDVNYYTITSPDGSLDPLGWNSLDDQNFDATDGPDGGDIAGDSPTEGWDEAGGSNAFNLTEAFLTQMSTFGPSTDISLGNGYSAAVVTKEDLVFQYRDLTRPNRLQVGDVFYVGEPPDTGGDFNNDGDYTCLDVDALVAEIVAGDNTAGFDLTDDELVDGDDLTAWLAEAGAAELASENPYLLGDANLDGTVDGADFLIWNSNKFTEIPAWCAGDFNASGLVDGADFLIWNSFKFQSADGVAAVPEPSVGVFALMGLLWFGFRELRT